MPFLNAQERTALANELSKKTFNQAKGKLQGMDKKGRLAIYRNVQYVNEWYTRFVLPSYGVQVTLIESKAEQVNKHGKTDVIYTLSRVDVEPTPENRI